MIWQELEQAITAMAATCRGQGLQRGDRLDTLLPNGLQLMVSYLACQQAGLVV